MAYDKLTKPNTPSYSTVTRPSGDTAITIDSLNDFASTIDTLSSWKSTIDEMTGITSIYDKLTKPTI